jgi:Zn-dependent protease with chaperone function
MVNISAARVAAVEKQASESPKWFRFKVGLIAVSAEIVFQVALITPWLLMLGLGVIWFRQPLFIGCGLITVLSIWWAIQPSFRVEGYKVNRSEAPSLYALLDDVVAQADALEIHEIRIDDDFNAGAMELGHGWILGKIRRILILGGPLIASLTTSSLKAVIAHEIGHFSRQHGRLGHWVYRARIGWAHNASFTDERDSVLDKGLAAFATKFLQWFDDYAFVYSRHCEYEADAVAARIVGESNLVTAFAEVELIAKRFYNDAVSGQDELNHKHLRMPKNIWQLKAQRIKSLPFLYDDLLRIWETPPALNDTHPPISYRSAALLCNMEVIWPAIAAGVFKETGKCEDIGYVNAALAHTAKHAIDWQLDYARLTTQQEIGWQPELLSADHRLFTDACQQLDNEDMFAVATLRGLIKSNPTWTAAIREKLASVPQQWLTLEERDNNLRLLDLAYQRRRLAKNLWFKEFYENKQNFSTIETKVFQVLMSCINAHPYIDSAGFAQSSAFIDSGKRSYPLTFAWIKVNSKKLLENRLSDDYVANQIAYQIQQIIGANTLVAVIPTYSTESEPSWVTKLTRTES